MKEFILLGEYDKKILLPFLLAAFLIITGYLGELIPGVEYSYYVADFGTSFGFMLVRLIPYIFRYKSKKPISKYCNKKNLKDYSLFFLFYTLYRATVLTVHFTDFDESRVNFFCTNESFELICLLIISRFLLKNRYYIHNIISLLSFCIFNTLIDLVTGIIFKLQVIDLAYSGIIITEEVFYCYMKYMLDKKYHKYWDLIFFQGVYLIIYVIISIFIRIKINGNSDFIINYFNKENMGPVIGIFFFNLVCTGIIQQILNVLIIDLFTPNHMLIAYVIKKIKKLLFNNPESDNTRFYCIIPFIFELLSLLFYVEILECNFCSLNKNTKRNILLREIDEMSEKENIDNDSEIEDDLIINNNQSEQEIDDNSIYS